MLDGFEFSMYKNYYYKSSYQTETGLEAATKRCKEDINCTMVSALDCGLDSEYKLCEHSTDLLPKVDSCTLYKIGKNNWIQNTEIFFHLNNIYFC